MAKETDCMQDLVCFSHPNGGEPLIGRVVKILSRDTVLAVEVDDDEEAHPVVLKIRDAVAGDNKQMRELIDDPFRVQWIGSVIS